MKKFFLMLSLILFLTCDICSASVQVLGKGTTERSAIHDAMRTAIEQELGTQISNKTLVQNAQVINDEINLNSNGYVSSYKIISKKIVNGIFEILLDIEVNANEIKTHLMSKLQKETLINDNADSPRVAVLAYDTLGKEYPEVENEIISALKRQGFTRTVDPSQINVAVKKRIATADNDPTLRKSLANDLHIDYLVISNIKFTSARSVSLSSRLIAVNTGEIIYAGTAGGQLGMFTGGGNSLALKNAAQRAGFEISNSALKNAATVERHITLLITAPTFQMLGGTLTSASERFKTIIDGLNDLYVRRMSHGSLEVDVDFDGTAADFALELEREGFKVLEISSDYIKI